MKLIIILFWKNENRLVPDYDHLEHNLIMKHEVQYLASTTINRKEEKNCNVKKDRLDDEFEKIL